MPQSLLHRTQVALDANAAAYRRVVQTSAPGDCWDYLILTAANEKQAQGYRQELALRHRSVGPTGSFFPAIQRSIVVPDPPNRRAGSGGATLGALCELCHQFHLPLSDLQHLRILLIHSGGASQRLPAYSPLGKIFAPLPLLRPDGQICTLFDHLYLTLAGLPERLGPGMLILAGDVFFVFDHRHVSTPPPGVTALTMRVDPELARSHGIFVTDPQNRIRQTLQKASPDLMRQSHALDQDNQVLIDTGLLFFDPHRTQLLASLAGISHNLGCHRHLPDRASKHPKPLHHRHLPIDLYDDIAAALALSTDHAEYTKNSHPHLSRELWKHLHGIPFQTMLLEGQFLHLGTTRQFRDAMVGHNPSPAADLFQQNILVHSPTPIPTHSRVYHSAFLTPPESASSDSHTLAPDSVIEHSILSANSRIGKGAVVSQVLALNHPLNLPDNLLFFQVPIRHAPPRNTGKSHLATPNSPLLYVHVLCGVEDDFKGQYPNCLFLNKPIDEFLTRHRLTQKDIWHNTPPPRRTLWTARLFPGTPNRDSAHATLWFTQSKSPTASVKAWKKAPRFSMAMLLEQADPLALIEHREIVAAYLQTQSLLHSLRNADDKPLDTFIAHYSSPAAYDACLSQLLSFAKDKKTGTGTVSSLARGSRQPASNDSSFIVHHSSFLHQSRAYWLAAQLLQRPDHPAAHARTHIDRYMTSAFAKIAEASEPQFPLSTSPFHPLSHSLPLQPGLRIEATSPVRLDLSGGWSDTPPYCYERGGHVVNVAINLDNHPPIRAMVRTIAQPLLILESNDLGTHLEITSLDQLRSSPSVHDPFALHKVALHMVGLLPNPATKPNRTPDLQSHLKNLGAGLILSTECRVPKGSGLGTSSILSATLLAALHQLSPSPQFENQESIIDNLIQETLLLEQRLSTGGGWQDQIGGIVGGLKSTTANPGIPQQPLIEPLPLSDHLYSAFQDRLVVYYSGQQRLARDILRRVMGRYLAREPAVLLLLDQLKKSAATLRAALLKGNWTATAREIARYWELKKQLYPGSTTPTIDVLFLELAEHYLAAGLAGAGGGGFAYFFCKNPTQAARLRDTLAKRSARPGSLGAVFQTQINRTGLSVSRKTS
ncbi:MAG: hypothetical protein NTU53_03385 [Planctomycetota bacterium]|nr:hypothetical protein [Planctomycetota bacterium]